MLLNEIKKLPAKLKTRNFVAKHARTMTGGAGRHEDKKGKNAARNRQKTEWKRDARAEM